MPHGLPREAGGRFANHSKVHVLHFYPLCKHAECATMSLVDRSSLPGLRERKVRETRFALESAAVELALELGVEQVTVEQIVERANVSSRTFFNYFAAKEDALLGHSLRDTDARFLASFPTESSGSSVYEDLKSFVVNRTSEQIFSDELLEKRMRVLATSPNLAKRQMDQMEDFLDRLTVRVALRLAAEAGVADAEPGRELVAQANMLLRMCAAVISYTLESWRREGGTSEPESAILGSFGLLERTIETQVRRQGVESVAGT